jgi:hypothetical protein
VISLDDFIEQWGEGIVRVVGSSVDTDSGVSPLGSREDSLLERETVFVSSVFAFLPDIRGKALGKEGFSSGREMRKSGDSIPVREMRSHHNSVRLSFS